MPRFMVGITVTADGYVELEAESADDARRLVRDLEASVDFGPTARQVLGLDDSLMEYGTVTVDTVEEVEAE